MSGMRRCNSRQSDVPAEEWLSQYRRRATSANYELPHDESMAIQPIVPTRLPRPPTNGFEELSLLTRDDVIPHLQFDRLKTEGILLIDGSLFARGAAGAQGQLPINLSREGLKEYLVFPGSED
ncbi:hypothetical protein R1flu_006193 [Riccia fluitans]|uniref:Uncharacterized protein n=1 Tax=Riccia fluitans TaxID=41844 RepID=A0ABD1YVB0_9MARC